MGNDQRIDDHVDRDRAAALAGLLDREPPAPGEPLPPMWHLVYFLPRPTQNELGVDGHPRRGFPEPPEPGMRRMFAGGRLTLRPGLRIGEHACATTRVTNTALKQGRTGLTTFVTTRTEVSAGSGEVVLVDERDIAYLPPVQATAVDPSPRPSKLRRPGPHARVVDVTTTLLFRFSALTYNAHRIHYDRDYARDVEGHGGLVVHGPLQALLMAEAIPEATSTTGTFSYRLLAPLLDHEGLVVEQRADGATGATISDSAGRLTATSTFTPGI